MKARRGPNSFDDLRRKSAARRAHVAKDRVSPTNRTGRNDLAPRLELVDRLLEELKAPSRNVRKAEAAQTARVRRSIEELGFCRPVLIGLNNEIVDGLTTLEALRQLGHTTVQCIVVGHLSATELRLLRISINRIPEQGSWDFEALKFEFEDLVLEQVPIDVSGFSAPHIDQIMMEENPGSFEVGDLEPKEGAPAVTQPGSVWILGQHRLVCGDARDRRTLQRLMHSRKAQLVLTDEPFNVRVKGHVTRGEHREFAMASGEMADEQFLQFNVDWISAALPYVVAGGVLGTFIDWRHLGTVLAAAARLGLPQLNLIVWAKTNAGQGSLYRSQHELLPLFKVGRGPHINNIELGKHGRWRSNVWSYAGASSVGSDARQGLKLHPTVKPQAMLEDAFLDLTLRGDIVLDVFAGSGSTLVAAENAGRRAFCVELDPLYCDVIIRRWQTLTGRHAILEDNGENFDEAEARCLKCLPGPPKILLLPAPAHIGSGAI